MRIISRAWRSLLLIIIIITIIIQETFKVSFIDSSI